MKLVHVEKGKQQFDSELGEISMNRLLDKKSGMKHSPENYAEMGAIEILRNGLINKDANPRVFLPLVQFLYEKYQNYKVIASRIGGRWDDHTVQQWVRVSQAVVQEPEIIRYLSEQPSNGTLTVTKAYRIISKFQDAYISLKVIELMAGLGDREIAEILRTYERSPQKSIKECKEVVMKRAGR